tara:strand:+ start:316 stop:492 length:177 start_codon:yes stop_codon:yes gene_type:complete
MEKRITEKTESYGVELKNDIKSWLELHGCTIQSPQGNIKEDSTLLYYIYLKKYAIIYI